MKRIVFLISACAIAVFMLCACSTKVDYSDLKQYNGVMFRAATHNWGEVDIMSDYWDSTTYTVHYDGTIEVTDVYNLSGETSVKLTLSDGDYDEIYRFTSAGEIKESVDGADGVAWDFHYYDTDGNHTLIYSGYTYGIESMEKIQKILKGYHVEE
ncbi:MAG: hypothetical protein KBS96_07295 [Lachnospiraceae bacterium]|nr:hypothetical protein [Candidatus Colinaster scatohippi]